MLEGAVEPAQIRLSSRGPGAARAFVYSWKVGRAAAAAAGAAAASKAAAEDAAGRMDCCQVAADVE